MSRIRSIVHEIKYGLLLIIATLGITSCTSPEVSELKTSAAWDQASCNELAAASGLYLVGVGELLAKSEAAREKGETEIADKASGRRS